MTSDNKWLTYKQAMDYLQIRSYTTLYKFIDDGLKVSEIGKVKRISTTAIDEFMNEHTV